MKKDLIKKYIQKLLKEQGPVVDPPPNIPGCTDPNAGNYDINATVDDGSCNYYEPSPGSGQSAVDNPNPVGQTPSKGKPEKPPTSPLGGNPNPNPDDTSNTGGYSCSNENMIALCNIELDNGELLCQSDFWSTMDNDQVNYACTQCCPETTEDLECTDPQVQGIIQSGLCDTNYGNNPMVQFACEECIETSEDLDCMDLQIQTIIEGGYCATYDTTLQPGDTYYNPMMNFACTQCGVSQVDFTYISPGESMPGDGDSRSKTRNRKPMRESFKNRLKKLANIKENRQLIKETTTNLPVPLGTIYTYNLNTYNNYEEYIEYQLSDAGNLSYLGGSFPEDYYDNVFDGGYMSTVSYLAANYAGGTGLPVGFYGGTNVFPGTWSVTIDGVTYNSGGGQASEWSDNQFNAPCRELELLKCWNQLGTIPQAQGAAFSEPNFISNNYYNQSYDIAPSGIPIGQQMSAQINSFIQGGVNATSTFSGQNFPLGYTANADYRYCASINGEYPTEEDIGKLVKDPSTGEGFMIVGFGGSVSQRIFHWNSNGGGFSHDLEWDTENGGENGCPSYLMATGGPLMSSLEEFLNAGAESQWYSTCNLMNWPDNAPVYQMLCGVDGNGGVCNGGDIPNNELWNNSGQDWLSMCGCCNPNGEGGYDGFDASLIEGDTVGCKRVVFGKCNDDGTADGWFNSYPCVTINGEIPNSSHLGMYAVGGYDARIFIKAIYTEPNEETYLEWSQGAPFPGQTNIWGINPFMSSPLAANLNVGEYGNNTYGPYISIDNCQNNDCPQLDAMCASNPDELEFDIDGETIETCQDFYENPQATLVCQAYFNLMAAQAGPQGFQPDGTYTNTQSDPTLEAAGTCCGELATTYSTSGCTMVGADNYDLWADISNPNSDPDDTTNCIIQGCTDSNADNYNQSATNDNGSCTYSLGDCNLQAWVQNYGFQVDQFCNRCGCDPEGQYAQSCQEFLNQFPDACNCCIEEGFISDIGTNDEDPNPENPTEAEPVKPGLATKVKGCAENLQVGCFIFKGTSCTVINDAEQLQIIQTNMPGIVGYDSLDVCTEANATQQDPTLGTVPSPPLPPQQNISESFKSRLKRLANIKKNK